MGHNQNAIFFVFTSDGLFLFESIRLQTRFSC